MYAHILYIIYACILYNIQYYNTKGWCMSLSVLTTIIATNNSIVDIYTILYNVNTDIILLLIVVVVVDEGEREALSGTGRFALVFIVDFEEVVTVVALVGVVTGEDLSEAAAAVVHRVTGAAVGLVFMDVVVNGTVVLLAVVEALSEVAMAVWLGVVGVVGRVRLEGDRLVLLVEHSTVALPDLPPDPSRGRGESEVEVGRTNRFSDSIHSSGVRSGAVPPYLTGNWSASISSSKAGSH